MRRANEDSYWALAFYIIQLLKGVSIRQMREASLSNRDQTKTVRHPISSLVRDENGDHRIEAVLWFATASGTIWTNALNRAVKTLATEILKRGDHGRSQRELQESILAHLDRDAMAAILANKYLSILTREVRTYLQIDLDLQMRRVDANASGFFDVIILTMDIADAGKIYNCMVSIDRTGRLEGLREHTAVMRNWEWGLLLASFIQCIDRVCRKRMSVHARLFREICRDRDLVHRALIEGLDQPSLKRAVYGAPTDMGTSGTLH
jgi:hypothetical protein